MLITPATYQSRVVCFFLWSVFLQFANQHYTLPVFSNFGFIHSLRYCRKEKAHPWGFGREFNEGTIYQGLRWDTLRLVKGLSRNKAINPCRREMAKRNELLGWSHRAVPEGYLTGALARVGAGTAKTVGPGQSLRMHALTSFSHLLTFYWRLSWAASKQRAEAQVPEGCRGRWMRMCGPRQADMQN